MLYIELDGGITRMQPQSINWEPPSGLGNDGQGAPVYGPYWSCSLGFSYLTLVEYERWHDAVDGAMHTVRLPHPTTGAMTNYTAYVAFVTPRLRTDVSGVCRAGTTGADIGLSRITVT
ncbi:hypothetical protein KKH23_05365 [Patescibacteria group bacterium]|nr:hypothetical protein [Patescibacteria group bacterium]